jgi:tetratricopeptide (TPR) repeat protein
MPNNPSEFDIFISYDPLDDKPTSQSAPLGWVSTLFERIVEEHRRYSPEPLRVFCDTGTVKDMGDWRQRILPALRSSKVLLICLSPNYFNSELCRAEWKEYIATHSGDSGPATVYYVEVPGSNEQINARGLSELEHGVAVNFRPWFPAGPRMLQEAEVERRLNALAQTTQTGDDRGRDVPGNVRRTNPYFVGRRQELRKLHEQLAGGAIGVVTAVHGLGGQGKTELACHYANAFADAYPGGVWSLGAEGKRDLLPLIGELAFVPQFGYSPTDDEKAHANRLGLAVLETLRRRCPTGTDKMSAALIILDNVSEPELLSAAQLVHLPQSADWLKILVTTRLSPETFAGKQLAAVAIDSLDEEDALKLIRDRQPQQRFATSQEEEAARQIVRDLGGFTLAVEQAAIHLGLDTRETPSSFLERLRKCGLPGIDSLPKNADFADRMRHRQKQLGPILRSTLESLEEELPAASRALEFAALLPPDCVPWPWLHELTTQSRPELADDPAAWGKVKRRLEGLRLLTSGDQPEIARLHRLVAAHLQAEADDAIITALETFTFHRAVEWQGSQTPATPWELDALLSALPSLMANPRSEAGAALPLAIVASASKVRKYRSLSAARQLLTSSLQSLERIMDADPEDLSHHNAVARTLDQLGQVAQAQGDLTEAERLITRSVAILQHLVDVQPEDTAWHLRLSAAMNRLADLAETRGNLKEAQRLYTEALAIRQRLADADPTNSDWQNWLTVSLNLLGDVAKTQANFPEAERLFTEALRIRERLAEADPTNTEWQNDIAVSCNKLGDLASTLRHLPEARQLYARSLEIRRSLAEAEPENIEWQDILSVSLNKVADHAREDGAFPEAEQLFTEALQIRQRLAEADPSNTEWQRDVSISFNKLGELAQAQGKLSEAERFIAEDLRISRRLAEFDSTNSAWQRDVSLSLEKLAELAQGQGNYAEAERLLCESRAIIERLIQADAGSSRWRRAFASCLEKLGELAMKQKNLADAERLYTESCGVYRALADADPANANSQCGLSSAIRKLADVAESQGNLPEVTRLLIEDVEIHQRLAEAVPSDPHWPLAISVGLNKLGELAQQQGNLDEAVRFFTDSASICRRQGHEEPPDSHWIALLSQTLTKLGELAEERGDFERAQRLYTEDLGICKRRADHQPENAVRQRNLAVAFNQLAGVAKTQGNLDEAKRCYTEALEIRRRLADADPDDENLIFAVSASLDKLADIAEEQGDLEQACRLAYQGGELVERLAKAKPDDSELQMRWFMTVHKLAELDTARGEWLGALMYHRLAADIIRPLAEASAENVSLQAALVKSLIGMGNIYQYIEGLPEAQASFAECICVLDRLDRLSPGNSSVQSALWRTHQRLAKTLEEQASDEARSHWQAAHDILSAMLKDGMDVPAEDRDALIDLRCKLEGDETPYPK